VNELNNIRNYLPVSDRIASSGQPEEMDFKHIANAGYDWVINLAMPNSEHAITEEGNIVTARKMNCLHIPVPIDAPEPDHLKRFLLAMDAWQDCNVGTLCGQLSSIGISISVFPIDAPAVA
jgi:protein tyrosine phosphatase (PTP) superfamily phosphohydrolase (DUF442 family)